MIAYLSKTSDRLSLCLFFILALSIYSPAQEYNPVRLWRYTVQDDARYGEFGFGLGDQNGDGYGDFMTYSVGEPEPKALFYGGIEPDTIPDLGFPERWGFPGEPIGDVNGDGLIDVFNLHPPQSIYLSPIDTVPFHFEYEGPVNDLWFLGLKDINGDSIDDFIVRDKRYAGRPLDVHRIVYRIIFGSEELDTNWVWNNQWDDFDHRSFDHSSGDLDGNGHNDIICRITQEDIWAIYFSEGEIPDTLPDMDLAEWLREREQRIMMWEVVGDVNCDGADDVMMITDDVPFTRENFATVKNDLNLFFGGENLDAEPESRETLIILDYPNLEISLSTIGDINNDGNPDVAVGLTDDWVSLGTVLIYLGGEDFDLEPDIVMERERGFGFHLAPAGDVNGNGIDDFLVGVHCAYREDRVEIYAADERFAGIVESGRAGNIQAIVTDLNVIPNPVNLQSRVSFRLNGSGAVRFEVFDITGRRLSGGYSAEMSSMSMQTVPLGEIVDLNGLSSGVFFIELSFSGQQYRTKFTILE